MICDTKVGNAGVIISDSKLKGENLKDQELCSEEEKTLKTLKVQKMWIDISSQH